MYETPDPQAHPRLAALQELMRTRHRFASGVVERSLALFGRDWADRVEETLERLFPKQEEMEAAVRGYAAFAMTSLRLQGRFERSGEYQAKTYAEAAAEVYHNAEFMQTEYLPGLFFSHYLWPHHYRQIRFFETAFLETMACSANQQFVEVGVGTGLYSRLALTVLPGARGVGLDISASSLAFAARHIDAFGLSDRYETVQQDVVLDTPDQSAENLICVEVLEHLEDPVEFLRALKRVLKPGGRAFVTAAVNAAHTDHIYLYRNASEVEAQLVEAGFVTEQYWVGQAYKPPRAGVPVPVAVAFVVS